MPGGSGDSVHPGSGGGCVLSPEDEALRMKLFASIEGAWRNSRETAAETYETRHPFQLPS